jgi:nicotinamide riboside kinase
MSAPSKQARPLRVCVTGAECTGKSALAAALGQALHAPVVHEASRDYFERKASAGDPSVYASDLVHVVDQQIEAEAAAPSDVPIVILDTDVLTIAIWQTRYFGDRNTELYKLARDRQSDDATRVGLYLLCGPDIDFVHDCVRGSSEERLHMHEVFCERLVAEDQPFVEIAGTLEERLRLGIEAVRRLARDRTRGAATLPAR